MLVIVASSEMDSWQSLFNYHVIKGEKYIPTPKDLVQDKSHKHIQEIEIERKAYFSYNVTNTSLNNKEQFSVLRTNIANNKTYAGFRVPVFQSVQEECKDYWISNLSGGP